NITLKLNNRKILYGISEAIGHADKMMDITVAIDKLDKIGLEAVEKELLERGIDEVAVKKLKPILELKGTSLEKLSQIETIISSSEVGMKGVAEMRELLSYVDTLKVDIDLEIDLSLARGLNYYTGAIFEVKAKDFAIGSISGGGRYDDLTGIFGLKDMSGVGISFGADRIYDVMSSLELFPASAESLTKVLFLNFGGESELAALKAIAKVRKKGFAAEIYPDNAKIKKQMEYANRKDIPFVVIIGDDELAKGSAMVKNMKTGEQITSLLDNIIDKLQ
ncbi:MAG: ATP phosphoribosyltransferase regulatory subunit, partial [Rikenellaceae bacterium]